MKNKHRISIAFLLVVCILLGSCNFEKQLNGGTKDGETTTEQKPIETPVVTFLETTPEINPETTPETTPETESGITTFVIVWKLLQPRSAEASRYLRSSLDITVKMGSTM